MTAPPQDLDRRGFLFRTAALLGAGAAAACEDSPLSPLLDDEGRALALHGAGTLHVVANESGTFSDRKPFVVGLLLTDDPGAHAEALLRIRERLDHFTELRYASNDRFKEAYAEAALDHFFAAEDLRFAAVASNASRSAGGVAAGDLYGALVEHLGSRGGSVHLEMERRFFDPAPDDALKARLEGMPGVSVDFVASHDSDLLQLGDLLTGSVRGDMARKAKGRRNPRGRAPRAGVKDRLIASIKERLNVQQLAHPSMARRTKFSVRRARPPF